MDDLVRKYPFAGAAAVAAEFKLKAVAHEAASYVDRALSSWTPPAGSADSDLLPELGALLPRSRDLVRNYPLAAGFIRTVLDSVVGAGLRISAMPDYRALGRDREWAEEWSRRVEALWRTATETPDIDASRTQTMGEMAGLAFRQYLENGAAVALPKWDATGRRGARFKTYFQLVEADRLCNPNGMPDSETLRGGVEIDAEGAPVAYQIRNAHPGDDAYLLGAGVWARGRQMRSAPGGVLLGAALRMWGGEWTRVPARTAWGRRRVIHAYDKERPGQSRGKPFMAAVMTRFRMLDHYQKTELKAAIVNAMIAAFIVTPLQSEDLVQLLGGDPKDIAAAIEQRRAHSIPLQGGAVYHLHPGEDIKGFNPTRPGGTYPAYVDNLVGEIAQALGMSPEMFKKEFSKSNFASARMSLLETWRFFLGRRAWLAAQWYQPCYELLLEEWVSDGLVDTPPEEFYANRTAYSRSRWIGPGRGWVDPVKEATGAKIRLALGLSTLQKECAEQGDDYEEIVDQAVYERRLLAERGLPLPDGQVSVQIVDGGDEQTGKED
ncbi:MAG: phage portal protein [Desulfarculus sp.]|nr:MAG: phage portal protein [Desulfarculus sp.]